MWAELVREAWRGVWTHRLRSSLTMVGIGWGLFSEMLMLGLGVGLQETMFTEFAKQGPELISVFPGSYQKRTVGPPRIKRVRMEEEDVDEIRRHARHVRAFAPELSLDFLPTRYGAKTALADVYAIAPEVLPIRSMDLERGRAINQADMDEARLVCMLGANVTRKLGATGPQAIGEQVVIKGVPLTIIGTLKEKGEQMNTNRSIDDDQLYLPITTAQRHFVGTEADYWAIHFEADRLENYKQAIDEVNAILGARQGYDSSADETLWSNSIMESMEFVYLLTLGLKLFIGVAGAITVFVGGVGIMNIMSVAIAERTNEIGVRKAMGATPGQIFAQFFVEALMMTGVAAGAAFGTGLLIVAACSQVTMPRFVPAPVLSLGLATFLLALTVGVGIFAGSRPALRAARMDPADSLRAT